MSKLKKFFITNALQMKLILYGKREKLLSYCYLFFNKKFYQNKLKYSNKKKERLKNKKESKKKKENYKIKNYK